MIILYPTDTSYAIGCDARSEKDINEIFEIKKRDRVKTLPLISSSIEMVDDWFELEGQARKIALKYWPGPLTLVLPVKKSGLSSLVVKDGCAAVRVPSSEQSRALSMDIGAPIVSTSANISGGGCSYSVKDALSSLGSKSKIVGRIIDAGELARSGPSTIVQIKGDKIKILRQGVICLK